MKTTRRTFLGGLAVTSVPFGAAAASTVVETQEAKCTRLAQELLAQLGQIQPHGRSMFGSYVDLSANGNTIRYGHSDEEDETLVVFVKGIGGPSR